MLPSPRHNEVGHWNKISVLNGWPAHAAVNASPATLRAACAGCLFAPADASLAVIVVRYSFRCRGLAPLVSRRLLPAHYVLLLSCLDDCAYHLRRIRRREPQPCAVTQLDRHPTTDIRSTTPPTTDLDQYESRLRHGCSRARSCRSARADANWGDRADTPQPSPLQTGACQDLPIRLLQNAPVRTFQVAGGAHDPRHGRWYDRC